MNNKLKRIGKEAVMTSIRHNPGICLEVLRKNTKKLSQDNRPPGRDVNPRPTEYRAGILTTRQRLSLTALKGV
jgi:hypothetical protein